MLARRHIGHELSHLLFTTKGGEFALDAIEGVPQDERHFSGLTLGITQDVYDEIVQEIAEFRKRIIAIATRSNATDEVYRLNVQFFPMTKKSVNKD